MFLEFKHNLAQFSKWHWLRCSRLLFSIFDLFVGFVLHEHVKHLSFATIDHKLVKVKITIKTTCNSNSTWFSTISRSFALQSKSLIALNFHHWFFSVFFFNFGAGKMPEHHKWQIKHHFWWSFRINDITKEMSLKMYRCPNHWIYTAIEGSQFNRIQSNLFTIKSPLWSSEQIPINRLIDLLIIIFV